MILNQNQLKFKVVVDAMGGDYAPLNVILGAVDAKKDEPGITVLLAGNKKIVLDVIAKNKLDFPEEFIINAEEVIDMSETPTNAIKVKKNSSIVVGANMVRDKEAHAFVSAGNTGAVMAASTLIIGRLKGVGRPTIGAAFPTAKGGFCHLYDVGASVDSKANHLLEYAVMADIFVREMYGIKSPRIGLLSVGEEESKGNAVSVAALRLMKNSKLNFAGNVEGRDILNGSVDIVICDGFVGNIILKFGESVIGFLKSKMKLFAEKNLLNKLKALLSKGTLKSALKEMDYQTHGGVPLLGINGISIIGHGSSSPLAIKNMILRAKEMYDKNLIKKFEESIKDYGEE